MSETTQKAENEKYCSECGNIINVKAEICPKCGVRQFTPSNNFSRISPNGKSQLAGGLFAILLGGFGAHKFYFGKPGLGVLYLLFFWTAIPAIIGIVEGIIILTMSQADFDAKFGSN